MFRWADEGAEVVEESSRAIAECQKITTLCRTFLVLTSQYHCCRMELEEKKVS